MPTRVLIVDDSPTIIDLVKGFSTGFEVAGAASGAEMWDFLSREIPDLLLLDILLKEENGIDLARQVLQHDAYADIPIIFVSSKNTGRDVAEGLELGVYDYIKKPFDQPELLARMHSALHRKRLERELREQSIRDALTGVFNRRYFFNRITQQICLCRRLSTTFAVALIDLDFFKKINDTHGHPAGDSVLMHFAATCASTIRPYDIMARYGGEEFTILFPEASREHASTAVARIMKRIAEEEHRYEGTIIGYTFSTGIVDIHDIPAAEQLTFENLLKIADERLYRAKREGRNRIVAG